MRCLDPNRYAYVRMAAAQKHRVNRPGRPLCDKACNRTRGLATSPPCNKPVEDCSTLHRGPQQGFVTEGPRQRFVTEAGTATNPYFGAHPHVYMIIYVSFVVSTHSLISLCTYLRNYLSSISLLSVWAFMYCVHSCTCLFHSFVSNYKHWCIVPKPR